MSSFPISLNLENKAILFIGAGNVAKRKIKRMLDFTNNITVIADNIDKEVKSLNVKTINKSYEKGDIKGFNIVIACVDNIELQKRVYEETRIENILYSCSDIKELCDFTFTSFIKKDDLTISISTNGISPSFSKEFKNYLEKFIPSDIEDFLKEVKNLRNSLPKGKERMKLLKDKSSDYLKGLRK